MTFPQLLDHPPKQCEFQTVCQTVPVKETLFSANFMDSLTRLFVNSASHQACMYLMYVCVFS